MAIAQPAEILTFWFDGLPESKRFGVDEAVDTDIRTRFEATWQAGRDGILGDWESSARGALALVILLDQFPRNMFRGRAEAFSSDALALAVASRAVDRGYDMELPPAFRQFFYLPFMHSEILADQDRCVALIAERLGTGHSSHPYALAHRDVVARFGRFPARNAALGRPSTPEEAEFLKHAPGW